ncbi:MAG: hypothetical protein KDA60_06440 [Planctomycetales bacterium]|nr:hypothetical protein [Planctomycetales bacterium]
MSTEHPPIPQSAIALLLTAAIGLAVVGYVIGIDWSSPEPEPDLDHLEEMADRAPEGMLPENAVASNTVASSVSIPAPRYSEMRLRETGPTSKSTPSLQQIHTVYDYQRCISCHDPHTLRVHPSDEAKQQSLVTRAERRAFNGAPPVIPHTVEHTDDAACFACHGQGARVGDRVANRLSHRFLVNCVQCHAEPAPKPFAELAGEIEFTSTFRGLPTPSSGDRAFDGAPPVIPHSTWMRENCLSCHGGTVGWPGLEVTHRWRTNCTQCHAVSAEFEQAIVMAAGTTRWVP